MIENDIVKLTEMSDHPLDQLEVEIWKGVETRIKERHLSRVILSCQAGIFLIAVMGSIMAGTQTGVAFRESSERIALSTRADLAPSTLLIGH